jgi:hypothetical protein
MTVLPDPVAPELIDVFTAKALQARSWNPAGCGKIAQESWVTAVSAQDGWSEAIPINQESELTEIAEFVIGPAEVRIRWLTHPAGFDDRLIAADVTPSVR